MSVGRRRRKNSSCVASPSDGALFRNSSSTRMPKSIQRPGSVAERQRTMLKSPRGSVSVARARLPSCEKPVPGAPGASGMGFPTGACAGSVAGCAAVVSSEKLPVEATDPATAGRSDGADSWAAASVTVVASAVTVRKLRAQEASMW
jgi:hypothetical protein